MSARYWRGNVFININEKKSDTMLSLYEKQTKQKQTRNIFSTEQNYSSKITWNLHFPLAVSKPALWTESLFNIVPIYGIDLSCGWTQEFRSGDLNPSWWPDMGTTIIFLHSQLKVFQTVIGVYLYFCNLFVLQALISFFIIRKLLIIKLCTKFNASSVQ